jgi:hypothetical protein
MKSFLLLLAAVSLFGQKLDEVCGACHTEPAADFRTHPHFAKGLSCDACHGASRAHREATGHKLPDQVAGPADQPRVCGACHAAQRKEYEPSKHGQLVLASAAKRAAACTTCHGTHSLRKPAAMIAQCNRCHASLPQACAKGQRCAGCHDPHTLTRRQP